MLNEYGLPLKLFTKFVFLVVAHAHLLNLPLNFLGSSRTIITLVQVVLLSHWVMHTAQSNPMLCWADLNPLCCPVSLTAMQ